VGFFQDLAAQSVESITVESSLLLKPIVLDHPLAGGGKDAGAAPAGFVDLARLARPQVTVKLAGVDPIVFAPYGAPSTAMQMGVAVVAAAVLVLAIYGVYCLARRR